MAFLIIIAVTIIFLMMIVSFFNIGGDIDSLDIAGGDKVGVLDLTGVIYNSRAFTEELDRFVGISSVQAIVIRIDSPGGAVAASQELYSAIKRAREEIPIVVSIGNVAASGGYYAAIGADTIVANPGSTTGSIGVIAQLTIFHELMDKIGIKQETIKSGRFKDTGTPYRDMTSPERDYLQGWVDDTYEQFIEAVAEERGLPLEEVRKSADGRVFTGRQALELGLIDVLGDFDDAVMIAGELGGIEGKPDILERKKRKITLLDILFGDFESIVSRFSSRSTEIKYIMP